MEHFSRNDLELLLKEGEQRKNCVSIYMPTEKGREKAKNNSTRFKSLLAKAEEAIDRRNLDPASKNKIFDPAKQLISDSYFWANQGEGLACFISEGYFRYYRLHLRFPEMAEVRDRFHLRPLFGLLFSDGLFYVLALSQKDASLYRAAPGYIEPVDLSETLVRFEAEFEEDSPENYLQFHTGSPNTGDGSRSAIYFGHGGEVDRIEKEKTLNYFRFIDREIHRYINEKSTPIILACVDSLAPLYREASKYPTLSDDIIKGNPENSSLKEIHEKAMAIIEPLFQKSEQAAKEKYFELKGTGKTSNEIDEILPAAMHGRISDLFVVLGARQWGRYYPENEAVELTDGELQGSDELIELAVTNTYLNNGNMFVLDAEKMPDQTPVAAIYRW